MSDDSEGATQEPQNPDSVWDDWDITPYVEEIELYGKETQKWDRQSKRILRRYTDDRRGDGEIENQERRFNALWANTQNLLPALYSRNPKPDVQRRFKDDDPAGRVASDVLERCLHYFCDTDEFASACRGSTLDYLLPGRGSVWVRYVPHFRKDTLEITDDKAAGDQDEAQAVAPEVIEYEETCLDYVNRDDYGHNICRTWEEVWLIWRKVYMSRDELKSRFMQPLMDKGLTEEEAEDRIHQIPLDYKRQDSTGKIIDDGVGKACIYEAWNKTKKCALWFSKSMPDKLALDWRPDPLKLTNFFPTPRPLLTNLVNESLIPTPLYVEYQDQAAELDLLTARISLMTRCLKVVGVHDASAEGLNRMFNEGTENELIPIQSWALFAEKGGMSGAMQLLDIKQIADCVLACYQAREQVKRDLDEITGMSDIIRGATDPNETAAAQQIKSNYATQRISDMQREVQRFVREIIRIMADVICGHFQPETIMQISGVRLLTKAQKQAFMAQASQPAGAAGPVPPTSTQPAAPSLPPGISPDQMEQMLADPTWEEVMALLRNNALRCFRVDIETDSIIKMDEMQEKQDRVEFLKASGEFLTQAVQAAESQPLLAPLAGQMLMFGVRAFPVGKELEGTFNSTLQKLEKMAKQAADNPKPDPKMAEIQADTQMEQAKLQGQMQLEQAKTQGQIEIQKAQLIGDQQAAAAKLQQEKDLVQFKMQVDAATQQHENELEYQRKTAELEQTMALERLKMQQTMEIELAKARIQQETAIAVARISAKATAGEQEESTAYRADEQSEQAIGHHVDVPSFESTPAPV